MSGKLLKTGAEKLLAALFEPFSIVKRKQDGKYLARVDSVRWHETKRVDDIFDTAWAALEFIRTERVKPAMPWTEVPMDEETRDEFLNPRN